MANITMGLATLSLEDNLRQAVFGFAESQRVSNRKWLQLQFDAPENEVPQQPRPDPDLEAVAKARLRTKTSDTQHRLADYESASLDEIVVHGAASPPVTPERQAAFLEELTTAVSVELDQSVPNYRPRKLPKDYAALLSITDGLRDNDLRDEGVCGVDGIAQADISKMTTDDVEKLPGAAMSWSRLRGWQLDLGFVLGRGDPAHCNWLVYYFCSRGDVVERYDGQANIVKIPRRVYGPDDVVHEHEKKWKWRLFYQEKVRFQHSFSRPMVFDGIVEWLEFYQDWYHRETVEYPAWHKRMVERVRLCYPDPHSDDHDLLEDGDLGFDIMEDGDLGFDVLESL